MVVSCLRFIIKRHNHLLYQQFIGMMKLSSSILSENNDAAEVTKIAESNTQSELKTFVEGAAKMTIAAGKYSAFYNPVQEFNRDITILVLRQFVKDRDEHNDDNEPVPKKRKCTSPMIDGNSSDETGIRILDALSASGLRAIRFAKEVPNVSQVIANDFSTNAVETMTSNAIDNNVEHIVKPNYGDAVDVMMQHRAGAKRFHAIDLDPYGSPAVFLDSAVQAVADGGILMVTCTDMAVLCGNTPEACFTKYNSVPLRDKSCHEMALRIVLRSIDSNANRYGRYIEPLLSLSIDFYIRVFVRLRTSAQAAKNSIMKLSYVMRCTGCGTLNFQALAKKTEKESSVKFTPATVSDACSHRCRFCSYSMHISGPIYTAPLHDHKFVRGLLQSLELTDESTFGTYERMKGVLTVVSEELPDVPLYYEHGHLMNVVKAPMPKYVLTQSALMNAGYRVSISHCNPNSIKTDAPPEFLWAIAKKVAANANVSIDRFDEHAPGRKIIQMASTIDVDMLMNRDALVARLKSKDYPRFQHNKGKNWGPKPRTKGSVTSKIIASAHFQSQPKSDDNGEDKC